MGEEVKITVIATGFRDQMPERRARMLSVEEAAVVSVPVVAPDNWMDEPAPAAPAPAPPRFLSQDEEPEEESAEAEEPVFFSAAKPAAEPAKAEAAPADAATQFEPEELELVAAPARPQFAELAEEPAYTPLPRDYASDFDNGLRPAAAEEPIAKPAPAPALFPESDEESQRDLDVPAFMRRLQF